MNCKRCGEECDPRINGMCIDCEFITDMEKIDFARLCKIEAAARTLLKYSAQYLEAETICHDFPNCNDCAYDSNCSHQTSELLKLLQAALEEK